MSSRVSNCGLPSSDSGLSEHVVRVRERSKRQRLAQAEDHARFVEQAREQRRADVPGVEDEMERPARRNLSRRLRDGGTRDPGTLGPGPEDAIVEEARRPVGPRVHADHEHEPAHQVHGLRIGVRGDRQQGLQVRACGARPCGVHGPLWYEKKAAVPKDRRLSRRIESFWVGS